MERKKTEAKILYMDQPFQVKPYNKTQLVKLYRPITLYVLNKWLKEIEPLTGPIVGGMLSIKQVEIFIERYGIPKQAYNQAA